MSVFIVEDSTYRKIAGFLNCTNDYSLSRIREQFDVNTEVENLRLANIKSFARRYSEISRVPEIHYPQYANGPLIQILKSLECIDYQIEVDIDRSFIDKVLNLIRSRIIRNMSEYNTAIWG